MHNIVICALLFVVGCSSGAAIDIAYMRSCKKNMAARRTCLTNVKGRASQIVVLSDSDNDDIAKLHNNIAKLHNKSALAIDIDSDADADFCDVGDKHDIIEFYTPPRMVPHFNRVGLLGRYSFDKSTSGHDFSDPFHRTTAMQLVTLHRPTITPLSPPCTMFSPLMIMWNRKKMNKNKFDQRWKEGVAHIQYCTQVARKQITEGRYFILEQPDRAKSWGLKEVVELGMMPHVMKAKFDMCVFGMKSPSNKPVRKRTIMMTNHPGVYKALNKCFCTKKHVHRRVEGSECGCKMSTWCQVYPPMLCRTIATATAMG